MTTLGDVIDELDSDGSAEPPHTAPPSPLDGSRRGAGTSDTVPDDRSSQVRVVSGARFADR